MDSEKDAINENRKWVTIKSFRFEAEAAVLAARLEAVEIPVFISNSIIASTIPMAGDHVHLRVPEIALAHAQAILHEFNEDLIQNKETNFRDASQEDIAFQKALHEKGYNSKNWLTIFVIIIVIILIFAAAVFNAEFIPNVLDPF